MSQNICLAAGEGGEAKGHQVVKEGDTEVSSEDQQQQPTLHHSCSSVNVATQTQIVVFPWGTVFVSCFVFR